MSQQPSANHSRRNSDSDRSQADQLSSSRVERVLSHNRLDRSSQSVSHSRISSADYIITVSPGARTPPRRQSGGCAAAQNCSHSTKQRQRTRGVEKPLSSYVHTSGACAPTSSAYVFVFVCSRCGRYMNSATQLPCAHACCSVLQGYWHADPFGIGVLDDVQCCSLP